MEMLYERRFNSKVAGIFKPKRTTRRRLASAAASCRLYCTVFPQRRGVGASAWEVVMSGAGMRVADFSGFAR